LYVLPDLETHFVELIALSARAPEPSVAVMPMHTVLVPLVKSGGYDKPDCGVDPVVGSVQGLVNMSLLVQV
jgi:hypothetical protein